MLQTIKLRVHINKYLTSPKFNQIRSTIGHDNNNFFFSSIIIISNTSKQYI